MYHILLLIGKKIHWVRHTAVSLLLSAKSSDILYERMWNNQDYADIQIT